MLLDSAPIAPSCLASPTGSQSGANAEASSAPKWEYNLPRGDAATMLQQFAAISGKPVLFMMDKVQGEQTNAIRGEYSPREALALMLAGTNLEITRGESTDGFVISRRPSVKMRAEVGRNTKPQPQEEMKYSKIRAWALAIFGSATILLAQPARGQNDQNNQGTGDQAGTNPQGEVIKLSPFTVSTSAEAGYGSLENTSGRLAKAYQDVPQMTNVVTSELIKDMKRFDTFDALTFVPGFNITSNLGQGFSLRGLSTTAFYFDGFNFLNGVSYATQFDSAFTDRIEIIKGPAPGSFGRGDPAGYVNYVSKDPTFHRTTDMEIMIGTGNDQTTTERFVVDTNGLLTDDRKTAYRLVAVSSKGAEAANFTSHEHDGVLLALERILSRRGSITLKTFASNDVMPGWNLPLYYVEKYNAAAREQNQRDQLRPNPPILPLLPADVTIGFSSNKIHTQVLNTTAVLQYKLSDHWSTRQAIQFQQAKTDVNMLLNGAYHYASDGSTVLSSPLEVLAEQHYQDIAYQGDLVGDYKFPVIDCSLQILAGGDFSNTTYQEADDYFYPAPQPLTDWNPNVPLDGWAFNPDNNYYRQTTDYSSIYGQLQAKFWKDRVHLTSSWRQNYTNLNGANTDDGGITTVAGSQITSNSHSPVLPAYSVLYKISDGLSAYALYSEYSDPPAAQQLYGNIPSTDPRSIERGIFQAKTKMVEYGVKGSLLDHRFSFSLCAYDLKQGGAPIYENLPELNVVSGGEVSFLRPSSTEAKGIEFECFGRISQKLTFTLNGTYIYSSMNLNFFTPAGQPSAMTEKRVANNPNTLAGYFRYNLSGNPRRGLGLTAGWKTIFSGWDMVSTYLRYAPYPITNTIVDLGLTYGFNDRWACYVQGNNIFERFFTPTGNLGYYPGRKVVAGVTVHL